MPTVIPSRWGFEGTGLDGNNTPDGVESYSFTGQAYGFSVLATSQTGGAKIVNYFTFDGGPTGPVFFYGFDGSYLGTMQPPGFP